MDWSQRPPFRTRTLMLAILAVGVFLAILLAVTCPDRALADETVVTCGPDVNNVFTASTTAAITADEACPVPPDGGGMYLGATGDLTQGQGAIWQRTPHQAWTSSGSMCRPATSCPLSVNSGSLGQYGGDFYWSGGRSFAHYSG